MECLMYSENNIEYQSYLQVMNFFTRGNSCKKFKNTFYEKKLWTCSRYILIHHWETADCTLTDWQKNFIMFQELLFGWKEFSVFIHFILAACIISSNTSLIRNSVGRGSIVVSNFWMRLSMISWIIKPMIWVVFWSQRTREITQTQTQGLMNRNFMQKPNSIIFSLQGFLKKLRLQTF